MMAAGQTKRGMERRQTQTQKQPHARSLALPRSLHPIPLSHEHTRYTRPNYLGVRGAAGLRLSPGSKSPQITLRNDDNDDGMGGGTNPGASWL